MLPTQLDGHSVSKYNIHGGIDGRIGYAIDNDGDDNDDNNHYYNITSV